MWEGNICKVINKLSGRKYESRLPIVDSPHAWQNASRFLLQDCTGSILLWECQLTFFFFLRNRLPWSGSCFVFPRNSTSWRRKQLWSRPSRTLCGIFARICSGGRKEECWSQLSQLASLQQLLTAQGGKAPGLRRLFLVLGPCYFHFATFHDLWMSSVLACLSHVHNCKWKPLTCCGFPIQTSQGQTSSWVELMGPVRIGTSVINCIIAILLSTNNFCNKTHIT